MNQHDAGAISAAKCRELLGLQELSSNHPQPWFPSSEELAQAVEELSSIVSPRGLSADDIEVIAQIDRSVVPWALFPRPGNYQLLLADAAHLDLASVHPARLFVMRESLQGCISDMPFDQAKAGSFCDELARRSRSLVARMDEATSMRFEEFKREVRANTHDRNALLDALNYPIVEPYVIEEFFVQLLGSGVFLFDDRQHPAGSPVERDYSWRNISTSPVALVRLLSTRAGLNSGSFIDLGCGSGAVMLTVALLTHFDVSGIEIERYWCDIGTERARMINRSDITFRHEDLLESSFSGSSVLFVYSPFKASGHLLPMFVQRLAEQTNNSDTEVWVASYAGLQQSIRKSSSFFLLDECGGLEVYRNVTFSSGSRLHRIDVDR